MSNECLIKPIIKQESNTVPKTVRKKMHIRCWNRKTKGTPENTSELTGIASPKPFGIKLSNYIF